jgi:hypothetical protein
MTQSGHRDAAHDAKTQRRKRRKRNLIRVNATMPTEDG